MIIGRVDAMGHPIVEARISIPRLGVGESITFLVDTGADRTCLHPKDAQKAQIPFDRLHGLYGLSGIGGSSQYHVETAYLSFSDDQLLRAYELDILIAQPTPTNLGHPSLLGRDIINSWFTQFDPMNYRLDFTVRWADHTSEMPSLDL